MLSVGHFATIVRIIAGFLHVPGSCFPNDGKCVKSNLSVSIFSVVDFVFSNADSFNGIGKGDGTVSIGIVEFAAHVSIRSSKIELGGDSLLISEDEQNLAVSPDDGSSLLEAEDEEEFGRQGHGCRLGAHR